MTEFAGWFGAVCFAICGWPQVYTCVKNKSADGISTGFLLLWLSGEIFTLIYLFGADLATKPLLVNYGLNLVSILIIGYYKCKRKPL